MVFWKRLEEAGYEDTEGRFAMRHGLLARVFANQSISTRKVVRGAQGREGRSGRHRYAGHCYAKMNDCNALGQHLELRQKLQSSQGEGQANHQVRIQSEGRAGWVPDQGTKDVVTRSMVMLN
jgi:hypothetical protein